MELTCSVVILKDIVEVQPAGGSLTCVDIIDDEDDIISELPSAAKMLRLPAVS